MNYTNCEIVEDDQTEIVEFLRKNRYYLLKLKRDMTVEEYYSIQKKRGYLFSVVMKIDTKIVAHIAAYSSGGQKICRSHQVFVSTFVIDKQYRKALFSLGNLYLAMIGVLSDMNYTEILMECGEKNRASLAIIRKFGGIMLTNETDMYHNYVLHNYFFGIKKSINFNIEDAFKTKHRRQFPVARKLNGSSELVSDSICIWQEIQTPFGLLNFMVETSTGHVCGIITDDFSVIPDNDSVKIQFGEGHSAEYTLRYLRRDGLSKTIILEEGQNTMELPQNGEYSTVKIEHISNGLKCEIYIISSTEGIGDLKLKLSHDVLLDTVTGQVIFSDENSTKICEMLPCVEAPYNLGYIQPHIKKFKIENDDNCYKLRFDTEHTTVYRSYETADGQLSIDTKIKIKSEYIIEPVLNFFIMDLNYRCKIYTDESIVTKTYDFDRDNITGNEEVIFMDFRNEEYSCERIKCIKIKYSTCCYKIIFDRAFRCFHQYNYIGVIPLFDYRYADSSEILDLGKITIKKE